MSNNKQTAVEWLIDQLIKYEFVPKGTHSDNVLFHKSKEMDKQQKKECWDVAHQAGRFEGKGIAEENWQTFEQYYNETFGGKDE
jgi:hypothetical protein